VRGGETGRMGAVSKRKEVGEGRMRTEVEGDTDNEDGRIVQYYIFISA